jgi:hypothetical protein
MFVPAMTSRCAWRVVSAQHVVLGDLLRRQNSPLRKMGFEVNRSQLALQGGSCRPADEENQDRSSFEQTRDQAPARLR